MNNKTLIFHIGTTKAGSTSIQNWLISHRDMLLHQGVLFPNSVFVRGNEADATRTSGHVGLIRSLQARDATDFETEIRQPAATRLVLSDQNIFFGRSDEELRLLATYFHGWDIRLIAVLRPQLDWLRSRHVEDVMSGFKSATCGLPALAQDMWDRGILDYRARLAHVAGLLGAAQVRALRFDDPERPLVPRMLEALWITPDPEGDAATIHANRRERDPELVEAKRRLNPLIQPLSLQSRLRIEHELRQAARESTPDTTPMSAVTGLDSVQIAALQASNDALLADGVLDQPLDTGRADAPCTTAESSPRTAALFDRGLQIAAQVAWQDDEAATRADLIPGLTSQQITALCDAIRRHPVSLHVGHPASAQLAAAHEGRLAVFLANDPLPWRALAGLDATETPSPLVALAPGAEGWADLPGWLQAHHLPTPGLVVVGPSCSPEALAAVLQLEPREVFFWPGVDATNLSAADSWAGEAIGGALLLRRDMRPATPVQERSA